MRWGGGLHFEADTGLGGSLAIDGGDGVAGTRASEAMLAALGACAGSDVASILIKKRQRVRAYEVLVRGSQAAQHPKVFEAIDVLHVVTGQDVDPEAVRRSVELSATRYCVVTAQLSSGDVVMSHRYRLDDGPEVDVAETGPHGRVVVRGHVHEV